MSLPPEAAARVAAELGLPEAEDTLAQVPMRGSLGQAVPTDPLIYRFYEIVQVYGTTLKALIEEEFGDGIMSAIDFDLDLSRQPDPNGDRVRIVMTGKFLKYKKS
jgi:cyanate lyase